MLRIQIEVERTQIAMAVVELLEARDSVEAGQLTESSSITLACNSDYFSLPDRSSVILLFQPVEVLQLPEQVGRATLKQETASTLSAVRSEKDASQAKLLTSNNLTSLLTLHGKQKERTDLKQC